MNFKKLGIVIQREYLNKVKKKSFLLITFLPASSLPTTSLPTSSLLITSLLTSSLLMSISRKNFDTIPATIVTHDVFPGDLKYSQEA